MTNDTDTPADASTTDFDADTTLVGVDPARDGGDATIHGVDPTDAGDDDPLGYGEPAACAGCGRDDVTLMGNGLCGICHPDDGADTDANPGGDD